MSKIISIIIPCYNVENYIDRCFDSLRNQTLGLEKMEIIFVNDASTDNTINKLTEIEKEYPDNVLVIDLKENVKQGAARNIALDYASAPYIGYVDSDDWVDNNMFRKMIAAIEKHNCDFVECYWDLAMDEHTKQSVKVLGRSGYYDLTNDTTKARFLGTEVGLTAVWNKVFKKSFLIENDIFFPEKLRYEDIFFTYLAFIYADSYYRINEPLYHYFVNTEGTTAGKRQPYQFDKIDIAVGFYNICNERGLISKGKVYKDGIEWMFMEKYYVYMLWEVFQNFPELSYQMYSEMRNTIKTLIPDYKTNPYREWETNKFDNLMLKLLDYNLDEAALLKLKKDMLNKFLE